MTNVASLEGLSFPDEAVLSMDMNHGEHRLVITLSGAWSNRRLPAGEVVIIDWVSVHQRRYVAAIESWEDITQGREETLKDISEMRVLGDEIVFCGFGSTTGQWLELLVRGGLASYRY